MAQAKKATRRGARKATARTTRTTTTKRAATKRAATTTARTVHRAPVKSAARVTNATKVALDGKILHTLPVGDRLLLNVEGHAARTDSPEFKLARATLHKIIATLDQNPYGSGPVQAHHGGSLWVYAETEPRWHLVLNWAGVEWAAQFCCDPAKVERLRQNAVAVTSGFASTIPELKKLGYTDTAILTTPITTPADVARYVDSIWNSCVPIPQPQHTGALTPQAPLASGVHNYPEPACGIPHVMRDDFIPDPTHPVARSAFANQP